MLIIMSRTRPLIGLSTQRNNQAQIEKNYIARNYMILKLKSLDDKKRKYSYSQLYTTQIGSNSYYNSHI